MATQVGEHSVR